MNRGRRRRNGGVCRGVELSEISFPDAEIRATDVRDLGLDGLAFTVHAGGERTEARLPLPGRHFEGLAQPALGFLRVMEVHRHSATLNQNVSGIKDAAFDKEFNKAASTFDNATRKKYYVQWQVGLNKKAYWIPLFYLPNISTEDGRIANFKPNPTNECEEWNTFEWVVKKGKS